MAISPETAQRALKEGWNKTTVNRAIEHQNRLKFHVETTMAARYDKPLTDFLAFVSNLIPHDKFKIFKTIFRYPVKTNEVTGICFNKLSRIFDGRNAAFNYQFQSAELREDWERYRKEVLQEPEVWKDKGWEYFKTEPNSVLIVDVPRSQETERPSPYFYWLSISNVLAYGKKVDGNFDFIIFRSGEETITVIDDATYRVFLNDHDTLGALVLESPHTLGYCPAKFFVSAPISIDDPDVKASPLSTELESLDWYLFFHLSKRHLDLYAAYPIYSGYEQSCNFSNAENGDYCDGGFLRDRQGYYKLDNNGLIMRCPKCGDKRIAGVGSFVEVPIPAEGQPDLRNPVQMLTVDRDSLDYNVGEEKRLREDIITAVCGTSEDVQRKTAINEQQVAANFESQTTALKEVKKQFEIAQTFVDATICRLRYGDDFISASINYGTEFFIYDVAELRERYKTAKESGASVAELDALQQQIIETEYRHDPTQLQRMLLLSELEPFRHLTTTEVADLHREGAISDEDFALKLNFTSLIRRFERENINILEFGEQMKYPAKIQKIHETIVNYLK